MKLIRKSIAPYDPNLFSSLHSYIDLTCRSKCYISIRLGLRGVCGRYLDSHDMKHCDMNEYYDVANEISSKITIL